MDRKIFRELFELKFKLIDSVIEILPETYSKIIRSGQKELLIAFTEAAGNYINNCEKESRNSGVKPVSIE